MLSTSMSKHPIFTQAQALSDICIPLERFNINLFSRVHINHDSEMTCIHNRPGFVANYLAKNYHEADIHAADQNQFGEFMLWDSITCNGKSNAMLKDAVDLGHKQFFTLIEKETDGTSFYHFATPSSSVAMNQVYLSNIDSLKSFIQYFNATVSESKELSNWKNTKLIIKKKHTDIEFLVDKKSISLDECKKEFYHDISGKLNNHPRLSKQQMNCLHLLSMGFSAKEIANQLNLSRRTVESYLAYVRQIYDCRNSKELISIYWNKRRH
ncbi:MAG: helix-turn-helix transcriptional regulator [Coxiellaceae bacterium]|nr:helix-turn-helix transcriptional regulator [Coxiellaceae bacterium]